ncbi:BglG family transcription antiterminator [Fictibacillus phosphorivorans]|uniref:BglG family transcription antiterminator n=1 Tax=Fictibacillus phosphorivorans TaxID=1221500 RepID=UPI00203F785B|nr:BglG family transcription antiterminator [Fictibacillus phosphorivorans]MCM3717815.1 BglG family transcription antiterminator [Fictibacillus phosphorivorans]MCM3777043.1 BglG family transcription antiterminator [Fictibacillus phosphorivorans]
MVLLNNRLKEIIKEFLVYEEPVTSEYLSKFLGVTSRTIRNDITLLNQELGKIGVKIDAQRGVGYFLEPKPDQEIKELIEELFQLHDTSGNGLPVLPEERVLYILKNIIMADDFITIEQMANELFVSKSTVDNDLKQVETLLKKFNVSLFKKPNYGIKLVGNEMNIRFCLSASLSDFKKGHSLQENDSQPFVEELDIDLISKITKQHIKQLPFKIADLPLNNLIMHIAIGIKRIEKGKSIKLDKLELKHIQDQQEYIVASQIVFSIEAAFSIQIPNEEIAYITIHLMGAKRFQDGKLQQEDFIEMIGESNYELILEFLAEIKRIYRIDLVEDKEFIYGLGLHLRSAMNRMKYGMNLQNPMLKEIKSKYPFSFELAIVASDIIQQKQNIVINEDEIGYIAVHLEAAIERMKNRMKRQVRRVAVVCSSGLGTAKLLAASIESKFPGLTIVGTYPSYSLKDIKKEEVDLILSTVPVSEDSAVPVLEINALLSEDDVEKVNAYISSKYLNEDQKKSFEKLQNFFHEELFFTEIDNKDSIGVIKSMSYTLNTKGFVDDSYVDSVLDREKISPTSIGNLVAIPHPIKQNALDSCIAIGILKKPIKWGEHKVQLVLLLALNEKDKNEFNSLFDRIWKLVQDKKLVAELCKAANFNEIITRLEKIK